MLITKIDSYRDGGTIEIITPDMNYCIDGRINSKTIGCVFFSYPKDDNRNLHPNQDEIKLELINSLEKYKGLDIKNWDWKPRIYELLSKKDL